MAKQMTITIEGKYRNVKDAFITVDGKYRKVKKVYITVDGKWRECYSAPETTIMEEK